MKLKPQKHAGGLKLDLNFDKTMREEETVPLTLRESVEMRSKLAAWEEDWNAPGMEAYGQSTNRFVKSP